MKKFFSIGLLFAMASSFGQGLPTLPVKQVVGAATQNALIDSSKTLRDYIDAKPTGGGTQTVQAFATASDLKASSFYTTTGNLLAKVLDRSGAEYTWNPTSTATDDGGVTSLQVTGFSTGRWLRVFRGTVQWGEVGGKTDGTDGSTLLTTLASISSIREIRFNSGAATIGASVNLNGKRLHIENGAYFTGSGSLSNFYIDAPDEQVFATSLTVTNLLNAVGSTAWFGSKADGTTDNLVPFQKARDAFKMQARIRVPAGRIDNNDYTHVYYMSGTLVFNSKVEWYGDGTVKTAIKTPSGVNAIRLDIGCQQSYFHDFSLIGAGGNNGGYSTTAHGMLIGGGANTFEQVYVTDFEGDAWSTQASTPARNANGNVFKQCYGAWSRNGFYFDGMDANNNVLTGCKAFLNRQWGFWDNSLIGGVMIGTDASTNGDTFWTDYVATALHNGYRYFCIQDHQNVEPGVTPGWQSYWKLADWIPINLSNPDTWNGTRHYITGGGYAFTNANQKGGAYTCYVELDQNPLLNTGFGYLILGGTLGSTANTTTISLRQGVPTVQKIQAFNDAANSGIAVKLGSNGRPKLSFEDGGLEWSFNYVPSDKGVYLQANDGNTPLQFYSPSASGSFIGRSAMPAEGAVRFSSGIFVGSSFVGLASANPATQYSSREHRIGDYYLNNDPSSTGSVIGWVCSTSGTPGAFTAVTPGTGGGGGGTTYSFTKSLLNSSGIVTLDGDAATPGNSKYYGTNGSGVKGFYDLPTGGGSGTTTSAPAGEVLYGTGAGTSSTSNVKVVGGKLLLNGATDNGYDGVIDAGNGIYTSGRLASGNGDNYFNRFGGKTIIGTSDPVGSIKVYVRNDTYDVTARFDGLYGTVLRLNNIDAEFGFPLKLNAVGPYSSGGYKMLVRNTGSKEIEEIDAPAPYSLPTASASTLGGIKIGPGLSVDPTTGVVSVSASSGTKFGKTGEDATAGENRTFDANGKDIKILNSRRLQLEAIVPSTFTSKIDLTDDAGNGQGLRLSSGGASTLLDAVENKATTTASKISQQGKVIEKTTEYDETGAQSTSASPTTVGSFALSGDQYGEIEFTVMSHTGGNVVIAKRLIRYKRFSTTTTVIATETIGTDVNEGALLTTISVGNDLSGNININVTPSVSTAMNWKVQYAWRKKELVL